MLLNELIDYEFTNDTKNKLFAGGVQSSYYQGMDLQGQSVKRMTSLLT